MRKADNNGAIRTLVTRQETAGATSLLGYSRPSGGGGMWGYWFCGSCNKTTGRWDEVYMRLWTHFVSKMYDPAIANLNFYRAHAEFDVGAFGRAIWAWAFALDAGLRLEHPGVATAILTGDSVAEPADVVVGLALTRALRQFVSGHRDAIALTVDLTGQADHRAEPTPRAVVAAPPFNVVVADTDSRSLFPHTSIGPLLEQPAGRRMAIELPLPIVDVNVADSARGPVTFSQLPMAPNSGQPAACT